MKYTFAAAALGAMALGSSLMAQDRSMIVLDGSGSMWGQLDGVAKIEIARDTMDEVLGAVPDTSELGLLVYGHRRKGDCTDIELAVPAAVGAGDKIAKFVKGISPKGKTPLSAAVRQAAESLKYTEDKATVILVTDGLETCDADPCALGRELEAAGVDFTAHVVGFGLSKQEGQQVACLADETGGQYIEASNADTLGDALTQTVVAVEPEPETEPEPEPEPKALEYNIKATLALSESSPDLEERQVRWDLVPVDESMKSMGSYGSPYQVSAEPGDYTLKMRLGPIRQERPVTLTADQLAEPHFILDAGILDLTPIRSEGSDEVLSNARIDVNVGKVSAGSYGRMVAYMVSGDVTVKGRHGSARIEETLSLSAGETIKRDVIIGTGAVAFKALYSEGGPEVDTGGIRFDILSAKKDLSGKRETVAGSYGAGQLDVASGAYVLSAKLDGATVLSEPFDVEAGALSEVQVVLNAGVAAIKAPSGYRIDILGKPNIQGERKNLGGTYGDEFQYTLPAGDYMVKVTYKNDLPAKEAPLSVTAGERAEVNVPAP